MTRVRIITRLRSEDEAHAALERGAEISPETSHHGVYSPAVAIEDDMTEIDERMKATRDELDRLEREIRERAARLFGDTITRNAKSAAKWNRPCQICGKWGCIHPYIEREDER